MCLLILLAVLSCITISQSTPYAVTYINTFNSWWPAETIAAGLAVPSYSVNSTYNIINLAFWLTSGPVDAAVVWTNAITYATGINPWGNSTQAIQRAWIHKYHTANMKVLVSAFGATEFPTSGGIDPVQCGIDLANFVKENNLDGVDLDWEDNGAMERGTGEDWLITITTTLRQHLPKEAGYIITHAPQGPYFMGAPKYPNGGYLTVHREVGNLIDFYNIQYYNQDTTTYDTYESLFQTANGWAEGTAVQELINKGIPESMIVVGKPVEHRDVVNTGFVEAEELSQMFRNAKSNMGWKAGYMGWQYQSDSDGSWSKKLTSGLII